MNIFTNLLMLIALSVGLIGGNISDNIQSVLQSAFTYKLPKSNNVAFQPVNFQNQADKKPAAVDYTPNAKSVIIYDITSGQILVSKNADAKLPMASLTKLMTVLTILQDHQNLDELVTIPEGLPSLGAADQKINVSAGEQFVLRDLLKATLIYSANDVANSLAIWDSGSIDRFADKMNSQAKVWGLGDSHFVNPTGLDAINHYASSKDLLTLSSVIIQSPALRQIVNTEKATITSKDGKAYLLTTTNHDLSLPSVYGLKTGQTEAAGQCLILLARNKDGHEIITIVLNSPDRFGESLNMVNYVFNNYIWK
jgi:D-alanyl-D-alanine carboxypeptidase